MYSDHDIFYRELVSNACDAITKLKKLSMIGEYEAPDDIEYKVEIKLSAKDKTIKIIDNGIGMTKEEVDEYINQIAFSGAEAFLEKYKDKANDDQIIGHFGLGFYSAFMVADQVTIDTLSFKDGAESVHWSCDGGTEYDIVREPKQLLVLRLLFTSMRTAMNLPTNIKLKKFLISTALSCRFQSL